MTSIHHNAENRPVRWTNAATETVITMTFDSQGRRTEYKSVTNGVQNTWLRFLYDGYLCIQVLYSNAPYNVFKEFVWDPTEPVATRPLIFRYAPNNLNLFYAFDGNKNVSDVFYRLTSNGIGAHYDYAPFGAVTRTHSDSSASFDIVSLNPFRFSSEYYDSELDLVYYNFRHYSPLLGRFLSRDPIAEQGGLNLYAFVRNNPNVFFDERGGAVAALIPIAIIGIIAIGVIGIIGVISTPEPQPIPSPEIPDIPLPDLGETTVTLCACVLACLAKGVSVAQDVADTCKRADPGDCTKEQHAELQKAVNETKGEKRCLPSDTCATLYAKETKWSKQAIARQIINNTCYKGGDSGHKQALEQAQINVRNCAGIIARKCMA